MFSYLTDNPCNGGLYVKQGDGYVCDCSSTGMVGDHCQSGETIHITEHACIKSINNDCDSNMVNIALFNYSKI